MEFENKQVIKVVWKNTLIGLGHRTFLQSLASHSFHQHSTWPQMISFICWNLVFCFHTTAFTLNSFTSHCHASCWLSVSKSPCIVVSTMCQIIHWSLPGILSRRGWTFLAGPLCGFGNGLQFMGGQVVGYAAADGDRACPWTWKIFECLARE